MKVFDFLDIDNSELISKKILEYSSNTSLSAFWNFLNIEQLLCFVPELDQWLQQHSLVPNVMAITKLEPTGKSLLHVDYDPSVRVLWPIQNCTGSHTKFFDVDPMYWEKWYTAANVPYYAVMDSGPFKLLADVELTQPIVFNPGIAHSVDPNINLGQRISFTIGFKNPPDHWLQ